jgi:hypothetical protein
LLMQIQSRSMLLRLDGCALHYHSGTQTATPGINGLKVYHGRGLENIKDSHLFFNALSYM